MRTETLLAAMLLAAPLAANAQSALVPYLAEGLWLDTNVFGFADEAEALRENGDAELGDTVRREAAGLDWIVDASRGQWRLGTQARRFTYQRFSHLDRTEYSVTVDATRHLGGFATVDVDYGNHRRMADFNDRRTSELTLEREQEAGAQLTIAPDTPWELALGVRGRDLDTPLPDIPEFALRERAASLALRAADGPGLRLGVAGELLEGEYEGAPDLDTFRLLTLTATADYDLDGLTSLRARAGQTRRSVESGDAADLDVLTWGLGYNRRLTGLTRIDLGYARRLVSYTAGEALILEDNLGLTLEWQPSYAFTAYLELNALNSSFEDAPDFPAREDRYRAATLRAEYGLLRYLTLQPSVAWRDRRSNYPDEEFDGLLVSLELRVALGED